MPRISRVLRRASQRSIQAKIMRASRMLSAPNVARSSAAHGNRPGSAIPTPTRDADEPERADERGGIERAIDHANEEIRAVTDREAQEIRGIEVLGKGGRHHGKKLPIEKHAPEDERQPLEFLPRREKPGGRAQPECPADAHGRESEADENPRHHFEAAAKSAQGVDENPPAKVRDGGELLASGGPGKRLGRGVYPSHESSCSAARVPPTMRRKISSRVSFSPGAAAATDSGCVACACTPVRSSSSEPCATSLPR